jgi:hypothetical protein
MIIQTRALVLVIVLAAAATAWAVVDLARTPDPQPDAAIATPTQSNRTVGYFIRHRDEREAKIQICRNDATISNMDAECQNAKDARHHLMLVPVEKLLVEYPE